MKNKLNKMIKWTSHSITSKIKATLLENNTMLKVKTISLIKNSIIIQVKDPIEIKITKVQVIIITIITLKLLELFNNSNTKNQSKSTFDLKEEEFIV